MFCSKMTTAQIHTQERIHCKASSHQEGLILYSWKNCRDPQGTCRRLQSAGLAVPSEENQSEPLGEKDRGRNGVKFKPWSLGELWESRRALKLHSDKVKLFDFCCSYREEKQSEYRWMCVMFQKQCVHVDGKGISVM